MRIGRDINEPFHLVPNILTDDQIAAYNADYIDDMADADERKKTISRVLSTARNIKAKRKNAKKNR